jgi:putative heme transporter
VPRQLRRFLPAGLGILVVVATFAFLLPRIADYRDVWDVVSELSWGWIAGLLGAAALNVLTFAPPWQAALPGLRFLQALTMSQASAAMSLVLPGGGAPGMATSYAMLRAWGFPRRAVAGAVTLVGVWNQLANLAFPIVAVFLLTVSGEPTAVLATAAFIGVAVFGVTVAALVLVLYSNRMARDLGDAAARLATWALGRIRRGPVGWGGPSFERFRREAVGVLRRRWHALTLATLAGSLTVFLVFVVALRALGVPASDVSLVEAFAAWALARLLGMLPLTPGGIGVVELSLSGTLIGFGGANARVVAAVLVYRFLTMVPPLLLGLIAAGTWRRQRPREALTEGAPVSESTPDPVRPPM